MPLLMFLVKLFVHLAFLTGGFRKRVDTKPQG